MNDYWLLIVDDSEIICNSAARPFARDYSQVFYLCKKRLDI